MDPKYRNFFLIIFLLAFIGTFVVYFSSEKDMRLTWMFGGTAIISYLIYRFAGSGRR